MIDLLVLAGEFVAGEDFVIHRISTKKQILEDVQGMRMVDGGLPDFPITFIELAALDPVQFGIAPADSVRRIINDHAVGPNDFRRDDFLANRPVHSNVRMRSPIRPEEQSALRMNGDT